MRILFLSAHYPPRTRGGAEISVHILAQGLRQQGHEVEVLTEGERQERTVVDGVPVNWIPIHLTAKPLLERRYSRKLASVLRGVIDAWGSFDIVHAHDFRTALALGELADGLAARCAVTHRDYAAICGTTNAVRTDGQLCRCSWRDIMHTQRIAEASWARKPWRLWQYKYNLGYRRRTMAGFRWHVFISQAQRSLLTKQLDFSEVITQVIYNPVPVSYLRTTTQPGTAGNVLYAGRVEQYKGVELLLGAWRDVARVHQHARLRIIGDGAQREHYERLASRWGLQYRVQFTKHLPWSRLLPHYDEAEVVVSPHLWVEPFGRTVAEAMARGKIVVAADHGGPAEMIETGKSGLLFMHGSTTDLARRLIEALSLPELKRRQMAANAREWSRQNLAPAVIAQQYEEYYKRVIDANTPM